MRARPALGVGEAVIRPDPGVTPLRVLILKPCCLGDVLLATPLARALAEAWPEAAIDWAVDDHSRPILAGNPHLAERLDATGVVRGAYNLAALPRLIRAVRRGGYDVVFVPDRSPVMTLVAWLGGVAERVGLDSAGRGRLHTVRVPVPPLRHEAALYLDLARAAGVPAGDPRPVFRVSKGDRAAALRALSSLPAAGLRVALHPGGGVNPGMRLPEKRWPAQRFGALVDRLSRGLGAHLVLLGGPGECDVVSAVQTAARVPVLDLAGQLELGQVAAVIEACDLYVGNDTGVTHLATAVGTPVVAIFGPTDPRRYGPVPGTGVAVAPPDGAVDRLADAVGSCAVEAVSLAQVWAAVAQVMGKEKGPTKKVGHDSS